MDVTGRHGNLLFLYRPEIPTPTAVPPSIHAATRGDADVVRTPCVRPTEAGLLVGGEADVSRGFQRGGRITGGADVAAPPRRIVKSAPFAAAAHRARPVEAVPS